MRRGDERRLVAGDRALRREGVHRLRARDPRDRVHGERRHPPTRQRLEELRARQRLEEADQRRALPEQRDLVVVRPLHLADGIGLAADRGRAADDPGACGLVLAVEERSLGARARLDDDLDARAGEPLDTLGHERNPALAGGRLPQDPDLHLRQV
jgi:hypothetical protein